MTKTLKSDKAQSGLVPCELTDLFSVDTFDHFWLALVCDGNGDTMWKMAIRSKPGALQSPMEVLPVFESFSDKMKKDPSMVYIMEVSETDMEVGCDLLEISHSTGISEFLAEHPDAVNLLS